MASHTPAFHLCSPILLRSAVFSAPLCPQRSLRVGRATFCPRQLPKLLPRMSLMNDLVVKGVEVAFATVVSNAVAINQTKTLAKKPSMFGLRRKNTRKETPADTTTETSAALNAAITELVGLANGLPRVVARGGPQGKKWVKLAICIGIDLVGSGSLGVPLIGDVLDLVTAPLTAVMLQALFANSFVTIAGLVEEILPGTDAIPTATLAWFAEHYGHLQSDHTRGEDVV